MKILVTGRDGQLGYDVIRELQKRAILCLGVDRKDFDITDKRATMEYIKEYGPSCVIHCAAYTTVDKAEDEIELCTRVNVEGTYNIALACKNVDTKLMYISTDYVFDGDGEVPYEVDDPQNPLSVYGKTKLAGEKIVLEQLSQYYIVRTSWVFGINGNNFVKTMLRLGAQQNTINVVDDQIGSPTYTTDLARLLCDMVESEQYGTYHATNEGYCSWAEFAEEIFRLSGENVKVNKISTAKYSTRVQRPKNSRMSFKSLDTAGFKRLPSWQDALKRFMSELQRGIYSNDISQCD